MNCKQGDLAITTRLVVPAERGTVVTCLELADEEYLTALRVCRDQRPVWKVNKEFTWRRPVPFTEVKLFLVPDCCLMPISPPDNFKELEDELWLKQHAPVQA